MARLERAVVATLACVAAVVLLSSEERGGAVLLEVPPAVQPSPTAAAAPAKTSPQFCGQEYSIPALKQGKAGEEWKLKHASVFTRHGDRMRAGMASCWAGDTAQYDCDLSRVQTNSQGGHVFKKKYLPGRNVLPGSCQLGQLTPKGYAQCHATGAMLRRAYDAILPATYNDREVALRSDDTPRTVLSGQALVNGLFPPQRSLGKRFLDLLGTSPAADASQEVTWDVMDHVRDNMFPNFHVCPRLNRAVKTAKESPAYKRHMKEKHEPLLKKVTNLLGLEGKPAKDLKLAHVLDCMVTHVCHQQPLPKAIAAPALLAEIAASHSEHYHLIMGDLLTSRYGGGLLVAELLQGLQQVVAGSSPLKFALFSGHDTGPVLPLLHAFKVQQGQPWPTYASSVAIELYQSPRGAHAVRMVYNGKPLAIPGCGGELCKWEDFLQIATAAIPRKGECKDDELGGKLIHWAGMFMASPDLDVMGANEVVSGAGIDL